MTQYKLLKANGVYVYGTVQRLPKNVFIPFDPANTDYAEFKRLVLAGEAELQDAEGVPMSAEQAQDYVKELP
jgi:hypothetical protein